MSIWSRICQAFAPYKHTPKEYTPPIPRKYRAECEKSVRQCVEAICEDHGGVKENFSFTDIYEPARGRSLSHTTLVPFCNTMSYDKSGIQIARHWRHAVRFIRNNDPCNQPPTGLGIEQREEKVTYNPGTSGLMREQTTFNVLLNMTSKLTDLPIQNIRVATHRARVVSDKLRKIANNIEHGISISLEEKNYFLDALYGKVDGFETESLINKNTLSKWYSWTVDGGAIEADGSLRLVGSNYSWNFFEESPISWYASASMLIITAPAPTSAFISNFIDDLIFAPAY